MSTLKFTHHLSKHLMDDLSILTEEDLAWQKSKPIPDLDKAYRLMSTLFVKYILITNSFVKLANMTVTYQKRERLKPVLSNLHGRILELGAEMAKMQKTDLPYLDKILMSMEMSRRDIELEIPEYYRLERAFVVGEFFRFTEKIKDGMVLKQFPKKPVPELTLDLRKYHQSDVKLKEIIEAEAEGRRIEQKIAEERQRAMGRRGHERLKSPGAKRPPKFELSMGRGEIRKIMQLMGNKRERVYQAMRTVLKQPISELYESWKFPHAREVVRAPYFQGKEYFHGYNLLINVVAYGKFITAIHLLQKHERARYGGIYFMIMKERNEKMFAKVMNRKKGVVTVFKTVDDFRYPIAFRDAKAAQRKSVMQAPEDVRRLQLTVKVYGLLPETSSNPELCEKYHQYKSKMRKMVQKTFEDYIEAEVRAEEEITKYENWKELDIIEEILEYFQDWLAASKPMVAKWGWDLLDIPDPTKKVLPPPNIIAGIPKVLTDQYIRQNFPEIDNPLVPPRPPPLSGTALIVTANHITPEQYMACKPLALARQAMPKEAREAEMKKQKEQEKKMKEKNEKKGKEEEGYRPQKSQIPLFVAQRLHDLRMAHEWEQVESHPMIRPKLIEEDDIEWRTAIRFHLQLRENVDKRMIALQKEARQKMSKKHRKAENLKKRNLPAMKKPKKEWTLSDQEKWEIVHALAREGYFCNYRNKILSNMPATNIFSFSNSEWIDEYLTEPEPAWGDLYQLVKLWCVLPLADLNARQYGPLVSAVGFVGPREVINRLVCAVAHETGSILIRIDPHRPEGDVPLNQLANMITKMAKAAQPTIILVDNCHLAYRKKEKGVPMEPSPYTKVIAKIKKGINKKFKVLMIGATDRPDLTNPGKMSKVFDKVIPFPYKDYHAAADYWGQYLFENDALASNFPYSTLVEPTKTYKIPEMTRLITKTTMTNKRKEDLALVPLKMGEFIEPLLAAKAEEATLKINPSGYAWASGNYKTFKARKKMLKELLNERLAKLNEGKDKKKKK